MQVMGIRDPGRYDSFWEWISIGGNCSWEQEVGFHMEVPVWCVQSIRAVICRTNRGVLGDALNPRLINRNRRTLRLAACEIRVSGLRNCSVAIWMLYAGEGIAKEASPSAPDRGVTKIDPSIAIQIETNGSLIGYILDPRKMLKDPFLLWFGLL